MFDIPDTMRMARALTSHAAAREVVLARNVANADTPGYKARDLPDFNSVYRQQDGFQMRRTRATHLTDTDSYITATALPDPSTEPSPNGNTVSLEDEMIRQASIRREHNLGLTVYRSSLSILRSSLGKRG
ncbi:MAG: FlgB family protein [Paracoccus sp. (in: a-proteobacteria)]|uniref:FlgB family protein n=1 Tax=Paracoccus sp. TaxID=267 RepID=UPI0026DFE96D|nr:FlgB family protein [Paracoccus sp. (in: a-proteobacteria)]MDO5621229.1 FlgB family protein [Paracoccus sp. (in: a-proteobacteria)]